MIELVINGKRADVGDDFSVRLNRQLINPAELNIKDAQYSFGISLPFTEANNIIFNRTHVEETRDKFNRLYSAELTIGSVRVFMGSFRMGEITDRYKGNLVVPAQKTVKDIFGSANLTDIIEYRIFFSDFAASINAYNASAAIAPQMAMFPYVLYGVLPKVPTNKDANNFTARNLWDDSVRIGLADLPPSINPLLMLKHIFSSKYYNLVGSAFDDEKLTRLYMSYKNPSDYVQPWNYGYHAAMAINGSWSSRTNKRTGTLNSLERGVNQSNDFTGGVYVCDLFDATNTQINITTDNGGNILYKEIVDGNGREWVRAQMRIPTAGFYKVSLDMSINVDDAYGWKVKDNATGVLHIGGLSDNRDNSFEDNLYEMRLVRDFGKGEFNLGGAALDGVMYYNNQPQNLTFDVDNSPKYFPQVLPNGQINFVDSAQDRNIVAGFQFGRHRDASAEFLNPKDINGQQAQILVAKPSISWDTTQTDPAVRIAVKSPGYWKYGILGQFDTDGDNPYLNIDYSGGEVRRRQLDVNGQPLNTFGDFSALLTFPLERDQTYRIEANAPGYTGKAFIHNGPDTVPTLNPDFVDGVVEFSTDSILLEFIPLLTLYLQTPDVDATGLLTISKLVPETEGDIVDWETTRKYAIDLQNAPANEVARGRYNNIDVSDIWSGQGKVNAVVWFEAGELLTLASVTSEGSYRNDGQHTLYGWQSHTILFDLQVTPFRVDPEWLKVSFTGNGTAGMDWNADTNFDVNTIDLVKFLPTDTKVDEFIENFCKAFNLRLLQVNDSTFALDVKQTKRAVSNLFVDLDKIANVKDRGNTPLGLPSAYKIGFTVDTDEEGFELTGDNGGGEFNTGVLDGAVVEQKSTFSYNWFKDINKDADVLALPIISKHDVWDATEMSYPEAMRKRYTELNQRFWYFDGLLPGDFDFNGVSLDLAQVTNEIPSVSVLNYKNQNYTILDNYFTVLVNGSSDFTEIEGLLTPSQYQALDGSLLARFNCDLYFVAEITGYDPAGKNKSKIKLIRIL